MDIHHHHHMITSCQSSSSSSIEVKIAEPDSSERDSGTVEMNSLNCISSSSTLSKSLTRGDKSSIATSTTTLNQLALVETSSCQCINSNSCDPNHQQQTPEKQQQEEQLPTVDPLDDERINVMREILNKCLTAEIEKRPSASEISDRLAKLI